MRNIICTSNLKLKKIYKKLIPDESFYKYPKQISSKIYQSPFILFNLQISDLD